MFGNKTIDSFTGEYRFLSNFYPSVIEYEEYYYPTVEHAYQAAKFTQWTTKSRIRTASTPGYARFLGKHSSNIKPDWDHVKVGIMLNLLREKFKIPNLRYSLLATGEDMLIEGNTWGDTFWGVCNGQGLNTLGFLLERVRQEIQPE